VLQTPQTPVRAFFPFLKVVFRAFVISRCVLHFTQYAIVSVFAPRRKPRLPRYKRPEPKSPVQPYHRFTLFV